MAEPPPVEAQQATPAQPAPSSSSQPLKLVVLGDSLTAGFGLPLEAAFPARLERALAAKGHKVSVINAGVSGDTAAGGRDRMDWSIPDDTRAVIVELGANDALRGIDPAKTREALDAILARVGQRKIPVLLCGMLAPRNLGAEYAARFDAIFPELARTHGVALYPFFLEGVATDPVFNQGDGLHPNAAGVDQIITRILPLVEKLIAIATTQGRSP
jgi:acyl-CoA thioesterase-1